MASFIVAGRCDIAAGIVIDKLVNSRDTETSLGTLTDAGIYLGLRDWGSKINGAGGRIWPRLI